MESRPIIGQTIPTSPTTGKPNFISKHTTELTIGATRTTLFISGAILHQEAAKTQLKMSL